MISKTVRRPENPQMPACRSLGEGRGAFQHPGRHENISDDGALGFDQDIAFARTNLLNLGFSGLLLSDEEGPALLGASLDFSL